MVISYFLGDLPDNGDLASIYKSIQYKFINI